MAVSSRRGNVTNSDSNSSGNNEEHVESDNEARVGLRGGKRGKCPGPPSKGAPEKIKKNFNIYFFPSVK